ncbi:MAG: hypothetical protein JOY54_04205 [Acidobacteriaceae bacterium]|nr:hypothetical protein [Acidobacteriaceae bacterium]
MTSEKGPLRRDFLRSLSISGVAALSSAEVPPGQESPAPASTSIGYPRTFTESALKMISFPLGGIGAGSIGLGGRGQLRDFEIFNRPDKGNAPQYAFASIWVEPQGKQPMAHILEARIQSPYEGQEGLGSQNAPGLSRLQAATFTGEFPLARIDFHDDRLPAKVSLEAGTPFIPLDADASGLPLAILRYRVSNPATDSATVSIAFSMENPVKAPPSHDAAAKNEKRANELRSKDSLQGLFMHNPALTDDDPDNGSFALAVLNSRNGRFSSLRGWPAGRWWNSPLLFWDDFSSDGELGPEPPNAGAVGAVCLKQHLAPGESVEYAFLLAWHFPNRTPERCGWQAPKGHEQANIGNWYTTRFNDAWSVAEYASSQLDQLEKRTRLFTAAIRDTTLPAVVKESAMSNLSTLATTTCFRTADGEFHAFEGSNDHLGCCFGNCTHVWNYETATAHLFPSLSYSLRRAAFGYSMDDRGAMYFRQLLPDGIERFGYVAADGQMGQIMKVYLDWQLSADNNFLQEFWPKVKRAIEFAWIPGGWDENRDGVLEGVQHNTYDVEFYGPNPLCGIYYLGALRAAEEMAMAVGDRSAATIYRRLFENGKTWLDANLFNGSYYVQKIAAHPASTIAKGLRSGMGADDPEHPQYQVGEGCLVDQLLGQYLADVAGLGQLIDPGHVKTTLDSIYRYNHKPNLFDHECVQRTFALNDEAAMIICDYANAERPKIPFPYYAEVMTGFEYSTAALMLYRGMTDRGLECIADIRSRYDGQRRNPWDEAECGHHYARAMASWSGLLALSGFRYQGSQRRVIAIPRLRVADFRCFWSNGTGWGMFSLTDSAAGHTFAISPTEGSLLVREIELPFRQQRQSKVKVNATALAHTLDIQGQAGIITLKNDRKLQPGEHLTVDL